MKFITKLFLLVFIVGFIACDTELDLQDNPNAVTPDNASVGDLYNAIQLNFANVFRNAEITGGALSRMYHMGGAYNYESFTEPATANGLWFSTYSELFPDVEALLTLTEARGLDGHTASVKILKAYSLMALVDNLNDVPLTDAGQGTDVVSPTRDGGQMVYGEAIKLLDEAITLLASTTAAGPANDFYYGGDLTKWSALANTLKLRAAMTTRLIDPSGAAAMVNSVVSSGNFISSASGDFQAEFGTTRNNPNSRHPFYNNHYEAGDGDYMSNYYMWLFVEGNTDAEGEPVTDPRTRYYFYRQVSDSYGQDPTTYGCHFSELPDDAEGRPAHYNTVDSRLPYCVVNGGYIGRDHGSGEGIPPDGPLRTHYGLYPGGGQFDDSSFDDTRELGTTGALGEGIFPIMLSSFVDFLRAEAALTVNSGEDTRALLESGMRASIAKVKSFETKVAATLDATTEIRGEFVSDRDRFVPTSEDIDEYVNLVLAKYDVADATGQLDIVMTEYYKALWGNGLESYNNYRRTGLPSNMAPTLEPAGGEFSTVLFYPASHVNRNAAVTQRASRTERVFWDDGSANTY